MEASGEESKKRGWGRVRDLYEEKTYVEYGGDTDPLGAMLKSCPLYCCQNIEIFVTNVSLLRPYTPHNVIGPSLSEGSNI